MNPITFPCPSCQSVLALPLDNLPINGPPTDRVTGVLNQKYELTCPLCSHQFLFGYIREFRGPLVEPTAEPSRPAQELSPAGSFGDGFVQLDKGGLAPNDQRSNVMNPNNPAYPAAQNNRSNQMNPNNPDYGQSRGGKK